MIFDNDPRDFYTIEQMAQDVESFVSILKQHDIEIPSNSVLETLCLETWLWADAAKANLIFPPPDPNVFRGNRRASLGFHDLVQKTLRLERLGILTAAVPHLRLLQKSLFPQNVKSSVLDQSSNKIFEYLIAGSIAEHTEGLRLDNPHHSKGDNPDVLFTYKEEQWAIACKVLHALKDEGFAKNYKKGAMQIKVSGAKRGIVLFNLKNLIDHDALWRIDENGINHVFPGGKMAVFDAFYRDASAIGQQLVTKRTRDAALELRKDFPETCPLFVGVFQSSSYVDDAHPDKIPTPFFVRWVLACFLTEDEPDSETKELLGLLNLGLFNRDTSEHLPGIVETY